MSQIRLTVDQKEDLELIQKIYAMFSPKNDFGYKDIIKILSKHPELLKINSKYKRNEGYFKSLKEDNL